jgi:pre-mRNA-processing factor 40
VQFSSAEEAEAAFMKMLKRIGAQADWTWPQAVRAGVKDSNWRAITDPKEREEAFKKYCHELRAQDKAKEQERQAKLRADFTDMLRSHSEIKHYTRWRTALPMIENEAIFRSAKDDTERRALFDEYILSLKKSHTEKAQEGRVSALDQLSGIFQGLDLEPFTRWNAAEAKLDKTEQLKSEQFRSLTKLDFLSAFERHIRLLQKERNDRDQAERQATRRVERKNRDAFKSLLRELSDAGTLRAGTKWKEVYEFLRDDPRYLAMLGQQGSTPLELFWDALEEEEGKFRIQRRYALEVLEVCWPNHNTEVIANATQINQFEVKLTTPFEEFLGTMRLDPRTANLDEQSLRAIYAYVIAKVKKREEEERRDSEYVERRAADDFRSMLKHLEPPVLVTDSYDSVRSRFEHTDEYKAFKSDLAREAAFEKYIRRLKDKEKDRERSKRDPRDRERDRRERDREYRNGHTDSHRRHRTRTRSPEHDPYAAERRQAQQDREARYRNNDSTGLSPPYRRNNRDDDRFDRPRRGSGDHYGRERREREAERERSYVSRADPRERSVSELDYGDSRPVSTRRRRESNESGGRREAKRPRYSPMPDRARERRSKTPVQTAPEPKEDPGLRSGSEEGEIEED